MRAELFPTLPSQGYRLGQGECPFTGHKAGTGHQTPTPPRVPSAPPQVTDICTCLSYLASIFNTILHKTLENGGGEIPLALAVPCLAWSLAPVTTWGRAEASCSSLLSSCL